MGRAALFSMQGQAHQAAHYIRWVRVRSPGNLRISRGAD